MGLTKSYNPIFVTGIERSGTSIVARILRSCGAHVGKVSPRYENTRIREYVDSYYQSILGPSEHEWQWPLPDIEKLHIPINWKSDMQTMLAKEDIINGQPWLYKSARLCQIWPVWHYAFPNARWIIVRRRTGDIVQSCVKTTYMSAFKDPEVRQAVGVENERDGWLWWVHQHEKRFVEMIEQGLNCKVIWPERMMSGDYEQVYEMLDWVGLPWRSDVLAMVDNLFDKSRKGE